MRTTLFITASLLLLWGCASESPLPMGPVEASSALGTAASQPSSTPLQTTITVASTGIQADAGGAYVDGVCGVSDLRAGTSNQLATDANWNKRLGCARRFFTVTMPILGTATANAMYFPDLTTSGSGMSRAQFTVVGRADCLMVRFGWTANDHADPVSFTYNGSDTWTVTSSGYGTCWKGDGHGGQFPTGENALVPFSVTITLK